MGSKCAASQIIAKGKAPWQDYHINRVDGGFLVPDKSWPTSGNALKSDHHISIAVGTREDDNCRLWDSDTDEKMDKDRFRRDLGGLVEAYSEIARRLGLSLS